MSGRVGRKEAKRVEGEGSVGVGRVRGEGGGERKEAKRVEGKGVWGWGGESEGGWVGRKEAKRGVGREGGERRWERRKGEQRRK